MRNSGNRTGENGSAGNAVNMPVQIRLRQAGLWINRSRVTRRAIVINTAPFKIMSKRSTTRVSNSISISPKNHDRLFALYLPHPPTLPSHHPRRESSRLYFAISSSFLRSFFSRSISTSSSSINRNSIASVDPPNTVSIRRFKAECCPACLSIFAW